MNIRVEEREEEGGVKRGRLREGFLGGGGKGGGEEEGKGGRVKRRDKRFQRDHW